MKKVMNIEGMRCPHCSANVEKALSLALCSCTGFSLVAASGSASLVVVWGLLTVMASLVAEHTLQGAWASP